MAAFREVIETKGCVLLAVQRSRRPFLCHAEAGRASGYEPPDAGGTGAAGTRSEDDPGVFAGSARPHRSGASGRGRAGCRRNCGCAASRTWTRPMSFCGTVHRRVQPASLRLRRRRKGAPLCGLGVRIWTGFSARNMNARSHQRQHRSRWKIAYSRLDKTRWRNTLAGQTVVVHEHLDGTDVDPLRPACDRTVCRRTNCHRRRRNGAARRGPPIGGAA